jgi:hypothetical protein
MMPYCEYRKCSRVAEQRARLLRMWDSYDRNHTSHTQGIWLCKKHLEKINKLLNIEDAPTTPALKPQGDK